MVNNEKIQIKTEREIEREIENREGEREREREREKKEIRRRQIEQMDIIYSHRNLSPIVLSTVDHNIKLYLNSSLKKHRLLYSIEERTTILEAVSDMCSDDV